jgi:mono/diheme cytochrome c family protein
MRYFLYFLLFLGLCGAVIVGIAGPRGKHSRRTPIEIFPDMDRQPKLRPQTPSAFFADGKSSRLPIAGTIALDDHYEDTPFNTGRVPGKTNFIETIPVPVTEAMIQRGRQRFNINCSPCHGQQADGNGVLKRLPGGLPTIANLHDERIVRLADGEIFSTITNGKNTMGAYGANVPPEDRWAIISYLRALQLSQLGTADDVPEQMRANFKKQ